MFFSSFAIFAALAVTPSALASVGVHCGTTEDATFSDCKALVAPNAWNKAWAGDSNVCHYGLGNVAHNVACLGNCCVYTAEGGLDKEQTRKEAEGLLGCADVDKNLVNALHTFQDGHGVCLSNGHGCGDCFDDSDFSL